MRDRGSQAGFSDVTVRRRDILRSTGAIGIAGLAGCTGDGDNDGDGGMSTTQGQDDDMPDSMTFGMIVPLSGPYGTMGQGNQNGMALAVEQINASDEVLPDTTLDFIVEDSKTDPETAVQVARELVLQENVDILYGSVAGSVSIALADFAARENIPHIPISSTGSLTIGEECRFTSVRWSMHDIAMAGQTATFGPEQFGDTTYSVFPDYSYGQRTQAKAQELYEANDITDYGNKRAPLGQQEWGTFLDEIRSEEPDYIHMAMAGSGATAFMSQAVNYGLDIPIVGQYLTPRVLGGITQEQFDALPEIYTATIHWTREVDHEDTRSYVETFKKQYNRPPDTMTYYGWMYAHAFSQLLEKVGTLDTQAMMKGAADWTFDTNMKGEVFSRACDHQGEGVAYSAKMVGPSTPETDGMAQMEIIGEWDTAEWMPACEDTPCPNDDWPVK